MSELFTPLGFLVFLLIVTFLVAAHEYGHYFFARLFKMGVEEFSIGVGKPSWTWMRRTYQPSEGNTLLAPETTLFNVRPVPVGGFVRIKGMVPEEDGSEIKVKGGFYSKPPWQRLIVLFGGPLFSVIAGFVLLVPLFMTEGESRLKDDPVIHSLLKGGAADKAGLVPGDRVIAIDGISVASFYEVLTKIRDRGPKPAIFLVDRKGEQQTYLVTPTRGKTASQVYGPGMEITGERRVQWMLGVVPEPYKLRLTLSEAVASVVSMPGKMIENIFGMVKQPSRFKEDVGGPITMVALAGGTSTEGLGEVINFAGMLSISLGILNLLPIGFLDGGQMVVAVVEWGRRGRRLSFRVQNLVAAFGMLLIIALILGVSAVDIGRLLPGNKEAKIEIKSEKKDPQSTAAPTR